MSVARAHGVVDHEVEGGVDVGEDDDYPQTGQVKVVMTPSSFQLWYDRQDGPAQHKPSDIYPVTLLVNVDLLNTNHPTFIK